MPPDEKVRNGALSVPQECPHDVPAVAEQTVLMVQRVRLFLLFLSVK